MITCRFVLTINPFHIKLCHLLQCYYEKDWLMELYDLPPHGSRAHLQLHSEELRHPQGTLNRTVAALYQKKPVEVIWLIRMPLWGLLLKVFQKCSTGRRPMQGQTWTCWGDYIYPIWPGNVFPRVPDQDKLWEMNEALYIDISSKNTSEEKHSLSAVFKCYAKHLKCVFQMCVIHDIKLPIVSGKTAVQ